MFVLKGASVDAPVKQQLTLAITGEELVEYQRLAVDLDFFPAALRQAQFENFLHGNNIEVYPYERVRSYLDRVFGEPGDPGKLWIKKTWGWRPLRKNDGGKVKWEPTNQNGDIVRECYAKIIPAPVLMTVKLISQEFPDALFFVSDAVKPGENGDPFLNVTFEGLPFYVVERWNEPGFRS